jgi:succinate dehydrogenase/fumarate reductase flavoprotein subunit
MAEPVVEEDQVKSQKQVILAPLAVKDGTWPLEFECAIRYINERYVSILKSEGKLLEGQRRLNSIRREFFPKIMAKNPHYLIGFLEARNILDLTELLIKGSLERKETRGNFIRLDYPQTDPSLDNMLTYQSLKDGKEVLQRRKAPELNPEYIKEGK